MPPSLADGVAKGHLLTAEIRANRMAKADLRTAEINWRERLGWAVGRVQQLSGLSLKEFAEAVGRDERQVARWITADERAQWDAIARVESLRQLVVIAVAEAMGTGIEIDTVVRIRRTA